MLIFFLSFFVFYGFTVNIKYIVTLCVETADIVAIFRQRVFLLYAE